MNASEGRLTPDRLADEAGTTPEYLARLVQAGAITADDDGLFSAETLPQVRLTLALADGGIDLDDMMSVVASGALQLGWVGRLWTASEPTGRTFEEFSRTLGERAVQLPAIYAALGLAPPSSQTVMHQDDERVIADFIELWSLVDDRPEVYLRARRELRRGDVDPGRRVRGHDRLHGAHGHGRRRAGGPVRVDAPDARDDLGPGPPRAGRQAAR